MLLPQSQRKTKQAGSPPPLETPEQISRSVERDEALIIQARCKREQIFADRDRFELVRDKIYLVVELAATTILLIIALASFIAGESKLAFSALGGGLGLTGLIATLHRPSKPSASS